MTNAALQDKVKALSMFNKLADIIDTDSQSNWRSCRELRPNDTVVLVKLDHGTCNAMYYIIAKDFDKHLQDMSKFLHKSLCRSMFVWTASKYFNTAPPETTLRKIRQSYDWRHQRLPAIREHR